MASRIKGITVEIGGDTTKLQVALKGVNDKIRSTQTNLRDVEKLLKLDPTNTELLSQKQKLLSDAVGSVKEKLEALKGAAESANDALQKGDITKSQYDALQREIIETEQDLKRLENQANKSETALQRISAKGEQLKNVGKGMESAGKKMMPVTAAIVGMGSASVMTAANFESSMSKVQATMGVTKGSMSKVNGQSVNTMDTLSNLAKKMGKETAFSAKDCADALNYLALAGYDTEQMCKTLPTVLNLATAGNMDLAQASDMVTDSMSALSMNTTDAEKMVDEMAKTASSTNTSVAQLGEGILTIGATAKSIKGGTVELNTALGILANNGIKGAEGGTHLRNIILSLQSPTAEAANELKNLGVSVYDSQGNMRSLNDILGDLNKSMDGMTSEDKNNIINKIFNKTDLSSVNALLSNTGDTWTNLEKKIGNSGGAAKQMAETQLDNLKGMTTILKSALESLAISLGELLMPFIKQVVTGIQGFVDWLNSLDRTTQGVILTILAIVAAIGPVLITIGKIIFSVGQIMTIAPKIGAAIKGVSAAFSVFNAVLAANPIMLIVMAIAALVAVFIYLWNTNKGFREFWINLWDEIKNAVTVSVDFIGDFLSNAWGTIKDTFTTVWSFISTFFIGIWDGIKNTISSVVEGIKNVISTAFDFIKNTISTIINIIFTIVSTIFSNILNTVGGIIGNIKNVIVNGFNSAFNFIKNIPGEALKWGRDMIMGIVNGIKSAVSYVVDAVKGVASKIRSFLHFSVPDEGPLRDYESWMPDFMKGLSNGIKDSRGMVRKEIERLSDDMTLTGKMFNLNAGLNVSSERVGGENSSIKLDQPILLDGRIITKLVSEIQYKNGKASIRNLGIV